MFCILAGLESDHADLILRGIRLTSIVYRCYLLLMVLLSRFEQPSIEIKLLLLLFSMMPPAASTAKGGTEYVITVKIIIFAGSFKVTKRFFAMLIACMPVS